MFNDNVILFLSDFSTNGSAKFHKNKTDIFVSGKIDEIIIKKKKNK